VEALPVCCKYAGIAALRKAGVFGTGGLSEALPDGQAPGADSDRRGTNEFEYIAFQRRPRGKRLAPPHHPALMNRHGK
jgi:hypothetical protein